MLFRLIRPILHQLDPEKAHQLAVATLKHRLLPKRRWVDHSMLHTQCFGTTLSNPIGLAAGFDKNAEAITGLNDAGFGFVEVGTVTLQPQIGNAAPRMFRLKEDAAVINRLGFNNDGVEVALKNIASSFRERGVLGINIGKNKDSEKAIVDYTELLKRVYSQADYVTINVSSPNTQGLRDLQQKRQLDELLQALMETKTQLISTHTIDVPILLKISPDIDQVTKEDIAELATTHHLNGLIISNTTIKRPNTLKSLKRSEQGGLSGKPLMDSSTKILGEIYQLMNGSIPLIGVGGIASAEDAYQKILHGASLIQLYTAFTYQGFGLIKQIHDGLVMRLKRDGYVNISEAVGKALKRY